MPDVHSALGSLHRVDVDNAAQMSERNAASVFSVEVIFQDDKK
jgi:hypothetical protein